MQVTFLIGNGFDLNCGLRSRYRDVYEEYIKTPSNSEIIKKFKNDISYSFDNWSDFEVAMSKYIREFDNENDFILCLRDFRRYLKQYLQSEEDRILGLVQEYNARESTSEEMTTSIYHFYEGLTPIVTRAIRRLNNNKSIFVPNCISFNYTRVFDKLAKAATISDVLHIHGDIGGNIILGMDNESQFKNLKFNLSNKTRRAIIKPFFNSEYDPFKVDRTISLIQTCDVLCVYGMSLGASDTMWKQEIIKKLKSNDDSHVFIFMHRYSSMNITEVDEQMDIEEDAKNIFFEELEFTDEEYLRCYPRLHIPCGKDIFRIEEVLMDAEIKNAQEIMRLKTRIEGNKK